MLTLIYTSGRAEFISWDSAGPDGQLCVTKREPLSQLRPAQAGPINMNQNWRRMLVAMLRLGAAFGDFNQLGERLGVADCQVSEHLAVDVHTGDLQPMHELVIGHALAARCGIDPCNPQLAHIALSGPAIAVGVFQRVKHCFISRTEQGAVRHPEALGELEDFIVAPPRGNASFYSWHLTLSPLDRARPGAAVSHPCRCGSRACCIVV